MGLAIITLAGTDRCCRDPHRRWPARTPSPAATLPPIATARPPRSMKPSGSSRRRYAKGEITPDEYSRMLVDPQTLATPARR